ncbi:MAG: hypothetical protein GY928_11180 [Colwellia sp.]|nr:hypothetical protein [Colwellia sp.]
MATREAIEKVLFKLSAVLPDRKLMPEAIDVYQEMLNDFDDHTVYFAVKECLLSCRFFPTIAEIREKATPYLKKLEFIESEKLRLQGEEKYKKFIEG